MEENEMLFMLDNSNQQMEERCLAGTPQLEVRKKHLRRANDRQACRHPSRVWLRQLWGRWEINYVSRPTKC